MVTADQSKAALVLLTGAAIANAQSIAGDVEGTFEEKRSQLLYSIPSLIGYYSDGSSALAADFYEDERDRWETPGAYTAVPIIADRVEKIRRGVAWAADPLKVDDLPGTQSRLAEVVDFETAKPYRDTILRNRLNDEKCIGWQRNTNGGCKLCVMLADRGAVYKERTVRFAAHPHCKCTAVPVFLNGPDGEEASVMQYMANGRKRSAEHRAQVREYLNLNYEEFHG